MLHGAFIAGRSDAYDNSMAAAKGQAGGALALTDGWQAN
jgi:hypothetical protein